MLTDKQSLILCGVATLGFSACGIIGILDNHAVIGLLIACFLIILTNIFIVLKNQYLKDDEKEDSDKSQENSK